MNCGWIKSRGGQILYVFHHSQAVFFPAAIGTAHFVHRLKTEGFSVFCTCRLHHGRVCKTFGVDLLFHCGLLLHYFTVNVLCPNQLKSCYGYSWIAVQCKTFMACIASWNGNIWQPLVILLQGVGVRSAPSTDREIECVPHQKSELNKLSCSLEFVLDFKFLLLGEPEYLSRLSFYFSINMYALVGALKCGGKVEK